MSEGNVFFIVCMLAFIGGIYIGASSMYSVYGKALERCEAVKR